MILHTNDVHCGVNDGLGFAGVAAYKADMEQTHNFVTLVDCGDAVQGAPIGLLSAGSYLVDIMNEVGYDFATFGNHEFDYKLPRLAELTKLAKYQYLSCNFKYIGKGTSDIAYKPYSIVDYGGTKVAFIGITTPESFEKSTPAYFQDDNGNFIYSFSEDKDGSALYKTVQTTVDAAKAEGAKYDFRGVSGNVSEDNPLYGLFRFKQGFGGEFTEFVGEADLVLSPVIYWAVEHGTSVFKDVRKAVYLIRNRDKK